MYCRETKKGRNIVNGLLSLSDFRPLYGGQDLKRLLLVILLLHMYYSYVPYIIYSDTR